MPIWGPDPMPIDSHSSIEAVGNEFRKAMQVPCIFFIVHGRLTDAESSFGKLVPREGS